MHAVTHAFEIHNIICVALNNGKAYFNKPWLENYNCNTITAKPQKISNENLIILNQFRSYKIIHPQQRLQHYFHFRLQD